MKAEYRITVLTKVVMAQFMLSFLGFIIGCLWQYTNASEKWNGLIYQNVVVGEVNVGGKTKKEAKEILQNAIANTLNEETLLVSARNKKYSLRVSDMVMKYEVDQSVEQAFLVGKGDGLLKQVNYIQHGLHKKVQIQPVLSLSKFEDLCNVIDRDLNRETSSPRITISNKGVIRWEGQAIRYKVQRDAFMSKLMNAMSDSRNIHSLQIPITEEKLLLKDTEIGKINTKIGSFHTSFYTSTTKRAKNIELAIQAINGTVLMPGQSFSFNEVVGERSEERGYQQAPVIIDNRLDSGIGGGVCQVSTTLYNAILRTGIDEIHRTHHSLPSSYVGLGMDATVAWDYIDFKFTNTLLYPIYIEGHTAHRKLYVNVYSNQELKKNTYQIYNEITNKKGKAYVKVYRKILQENKFIDKELISYDIYKHKE